MRLRLRKCHQPRGSSRPFIFFSTWLRSGRVIATAIVSPSFSATMKLSRQPVRRDVQQRRHRLGVVLELEEAEHAPAAVVELVEGVVELGADPADHPLAAQGKEVFGLAVLEVGVEPAVEEEAALQFQRWDPGRAGVEPVGQVDEALEVAPVPHGPDRQACPVQGDHAPLRSALTVGNLHFRQMSETAKAPVDVFEKARSHDRLEQLEAAKEHDLLPYFRLLTSQAGPVVKMEGRETIMLGSNNYLGLTGDERVKEGAREALEAFGTGVTGSRLLNGTTPLPVEPERELAGWIRTEDAIVYTTGYQSNVGCIGTILGPGDTVICDSGDHASILDGCRLSGAKLRPFRHNRMDKLEKMLQRAAADGGGVLV